MNTISQITGSSAIRYSSQLIAYLPPRFVAGRELHGTARCGVSGVRQLSSFRITAWLVGLPPAGSNTEL